MTEYGEALERVGDYQGAVEAYHRERQISNELFESQRKKTMWELQEKYDTEKKKRQIEQLSHENQAKGAELTARRLQQRIWWLLAVVFALAAIIVGLLYRKVRQANAQLEVKNLELKAQSSLDPLTALYNRRHFQEYMASTRSPSSSARTPASTSTSSSRPTRSTSTTNRSTATAAGRPLPEAATANSLLRAAAIQRGRRCGA